MSKSRYKGRASERSGPGRQHLAYEIARMMWEYSIEDFKLAKDKAVKKMGLRHAELPDNREIARELKTYRELFAAHEVHSRRQALMLAAEQLMVMLEAFLPRVVGLEAEDVITPNTGLRLHVFHDQPEVVDLFLQRRGIDYQLDDKRFRFAADDYASYPSYRFDYEGFVVQLTVFPTVARSRIPLSPVDARPMRRLSLAELQKMLQA